MRKIGTFPFGPLFGLLLLVSATSDADGGFFRGPYNYSLGPYRGDPYGWSYNEAYGYFGVPSTSTYPQYAYFSTLWTTPYTAGAPFSYRYRFYNPINPAYLTPPRPPGYTKESARNVTVPPVSQPLNWTAAVIAVHMPFFGELWVDGVPTEQRGTDRLFCSPPLEKGGKYLYTLRARWIDDSGKPVEQTQEVLVHCGQRAQVVFPKAKP